MRRGQWVEVLGRLIEDPGARERAGEGRSREREYSDERLMAAWDQVLDSL